MVSYDALSLAPREEIIIDADAVQRTAYSGQYTLAEYASGKSLDGKDISFFSVDPLTSESDLKTQHTKGVERWWAGYGAKLLQEEIEIFKRIRDLSEKE